jgi:hypothetical protein
MSALNPHVILIDDRGRQWRPAPNFQIREPYAPGWLLLRSSTGEELPYPEVVDLHGIRGSDGRSYLRGYYEPPAFCPVVAGPCPGDPNGTPCAQPCFPNAGDAS